MKTAQHLILTAIVAGGVAFLTVWTFHHKEAQKAQDSSSLAVSESADEAENSDGFSPADLDKMLADFAVYPNDEDAVDEPPYSDESIKTMSKEATATFIRAANDYLQDQTQRTATQCFGLGRVALLHEFPDVAKKYLTEAAGQGSASAWGYLGDPAICANAAEQWLNYSKAIELGFTPARSWKEDLELDAIVAIERFTADYQDPQLPPGVLGISNARLIALRSADIDAVIDDYGFFVEQSEAKAYLAYGLGRAAYFHMPDKLATARKYLEIAKGKGSFAAMSFLAYGEFTTDLDEQIELLRKSAVGGYVPAKRRLADALEHKARISVSQKIDGK